MGRMRGMLGGWEGWVWSVRVVGLIRLFWGWVKGRKEEELKGIVGF
ncbi:hypothetical protein [Staphylococcus aureus]|nr:hypothetical protein [Staphylococcus aureus]